jgi:hypothetical protein
MKFAFSNESSRGARVADAHSKMSPELQANTRGWIFWNSSISPARRASPPLSLAFQPQGASSDLSSAE